MQPDHKTTLRTGPARAAGTGHAGLSFATAAVGQLQDTPKLYGGDTNSVLSCGEQILPEQLVPGMLDFYNNYRTAVVGSGVPGADEALVASVMGAIADRCTEHHLDRTCEQHDLLGFPASV